MFSNKNPVLKIIVLGFRVVYPNVVAGQLDPAIPFRLPRCVPKAVWNRVAFPKTLCLLGSDRNWSRRSASTLANSARNQIGGRDQSPIRLWGTVAKDVTEDVSRRVTARWIKPLTTSARAERRPSISFFVLCLRGMPIEILTSSACLTVVVRDLFSAPARAFHLSIIPQSPRPVPAY